MRRSPIYVFLKTNLLISIVPLYDLLLVIFVYTLYRLSSSYPPYLHKILYTKTNCFNTKILHLPISQIPFGYFSLLNIQQNQNYSFWAVFILTYEQDSRRPLLQLYSYVSICITVETFFRHQGSLTHRMPFFYILVRKRYDTYSSISYVINCVSHRYIP